MQLHVVELCFYESYQVLSTSARDSSEYRALAIHDMFYTCSLYMWKFLSPELGFVPFKYETKDLAIYTLNKLQEGFFKNRTSFRSFPLKLLSIQFLKVSHTQSIKFTSSNLIKSGQTFAATTLDKKLYKINHSIFFVCSVTLNPVIHNSLWILRGIKFKKGLTCIWCKWKTVKG